ncbi:MAG TPA: PDZ domain-containing protein [Streptosporangiaceae bacterium]|nr:PDZ domain-containing protein [Streptosporangiaceae bacterium]
MSRRALTMLVAGICAAVLALTGAVLPVPYVVLSPGPTFNTLGALNGKPLITVSGHKVYPATGNLNLVTVSFQGGPGDEINLYTALRAWLSPHDAVVPQEELFGNSANVQQVQKQNVQQMTDSQQLATAAALRELKIGFKTVVIVAHTVKGMPAYSVLRGGDVITAVDGTLVSSADKAASLIRGRRPGSPVELTISRNGKTQTVRLVSRSRGGQAVIGVVVSEQFKFPFAVRIRVGDIGGPSAGMMFALGLVDKLTPDNLADSRFIAGTGEIDANGNVGAIGGIQQKMVGARNQGATIFLAPANNCADVRGSVPPGLRVVKVRTLSQAVQDLNAIKAGRPVPSC